MSQITDNSTICSIAANDKENIKALYNWQFMRGIHWSAVDFSHKGSVMLKVFSCCNIIMYQYSGSTQLSAILHAQSRTAYFRRFPINNSLHTIQSYLS